MKTNDGFGAACGIWSSAPTDAKQIGASESIQKPQKAQNDVHLVRPGTVTILAGGRDVLLDAADYALVSDWRWTISDKDGYPYAVAFIKGHQRKMHRFLLDVSDPRVKVDHRDGNTLNNQRSNLRACTNAQNIRNQRPHADKRTSKYKGVYFEAGRKEWRAQIQVQRKKINLGRFASEMDAVRAYDTAALKHFGEFARVNFPQDQVAA